ncbi:MAG: DUF4012 domain-containing protein [Nakamurella sp.]
MPQGIFAAGRARKARRAAEPLPPVNTLAAAGRRQRAPRNPNGTESTTTAVARMMVPGGLSKRRLAGTGEFVQAGREAMSAPDSPSSQPALPIRSLSGQEQAALWDWYDFDKKRSLLTTGSPIAASAGAGAARSPANSPSAAHAPSTQPQPAPNRGGAANRPGQHNPTSAVPQVPTAPARPAAPARPVPPARSVEPARHAPPARDAGHQPRNAAPSGQTNQQLREGGGDAQLRSRTQPPPLAGGWTSPSSPKDHTSGRPQNDERAVAGANAPDSSSKQAVAGFSGVPAAVFAGTGQQATTRPGEGLSDPSNELAADQRPTGGPPPHPLRRVIDPAGGQRTHPRRIGNEPSAERLPANPPSDAQQDQPPKQGWVAGRPAAYSPAAATNPTDGSNTAQRPVAHRGRRRRIIGWSLLGLAAVLVGASMWVGWRTYQAYTHLQNASVQVQQLQDELTDIATLDPTATAETVAGLQAETAAALDAVNDPIYRLASAVPFFGPNLDAVQLVTVNVDSLATQVMPSLVDVARNLQPAALAPKNGQIDLVPILAISPLLQNADAAVNSARSELATIDQSELVGPVADAVQAVSTKLDNAADVTGPGARTARLLPPMLGSDGPRNYLVVFQNPAEARATGGIFGSYAILTADQGRITMANQASASRTLDDLDAPLPGLQPNEEELYTELIALRPQDVNFTPDFPSAAQRFIQMYQRKFPGQVDGVLAIDPVALSYMLEGAPGIPVGNDKVITADNLVQTLLSDAYTEFPDQAQDERDQFLDDATGRVFSEMMSGTGDPQAILDGLRRAATERRILLYSTRQGEQTDLAQTGLAASLDADIDRSTLGVYLNDGTAGKLDYYLYNEVHVTEGACRTDGRRELKVQVLMEFKDPGRELPTYVTQTAEPGDPILLRTNVLTFAPIGGGVTGVEKDGMPAGLGRGQDHGHEVGAVTVDLKPGESTAVTFTVLGPPDVGTATDTPPALVLTPGVNEWVTSVADYQTCQPPS